MKSAEYFIIPGGTLLILLAFLIFLKSKKNKTNQFHLNYILVHFFTLIIMTLLYLLMGIIGDFPFLFSLILFFHILSILAFALHVESAVKGHKATLTYIYALPVLAYIFVSILNEFDLYLLNYATDKVFVFDLKIRDALFFTDKKLVKDFTFGFFTAKIIFFSYKSIDKSFTIKKKMLYKAWIYSYCFILILMHLVSNLYYFNILGATFDSFFIIATQIITYLSLIFILTNPRILYYLPGIKEIAIFIKVKKENYFELINALVEKEMLYLNPRLTINELALKTGISVKNIRASILVATENNFNDYINHFRVQRAKTLIEANYLDKQTTVALGEKSGFNSHQSFFRAFKKVYNTSPALYAQKIGADLK